MIKRIEDMNFYELLEVSPNASSTEIHRAYDRVRRIYDPNSIALYSLLSPEETAAIHGRIEEAYRTLAYEAHRKKYDAQLKRNEPQTPEISLPPSPPREQGVSVRYQAPVLQPLPSPESDNLLIPDMAPGPAQSQAGPAKAPREEVSSVSQFIAEFTGPVIKLLREQRKLTIRQIADKTKLSSRFIEFIEEENYQKLPARPYLRGFLVLYAKALDCDPDRVVNDYLKRYDAAGKPK